MVEVLCVLFLTQPASIVQKQSTQNFYRKGMKDGVSSIYIVLLFSLSLCSLCHFKITCSNEMGCVGSWGCWLWWFEAEESGSGRYPGSTPGEVASRKLSKTGGGGGGGDHDWCTLLLCELQFGVESDLCFWGHSLMMSVERGRERVSQFLTRGRMLCSFVLTRGREGVKNPKI